MNPIKTICIIDDTAELLRNLTEFLHMEGFVVWPYLNGVDALDRIRKERPDLIITDLWMPTMDGFVFIQKVRHELMLSDTPIIIFSAKPAQEFEEKAVALGVYHYIKKPSDLETILSTINHLIQ